MSELVKTSPPLAVEVAIEEEVPTDAHMVEVLKRQGFADASIHRLQDVKSMGLYLKGMGVLKYQRGRVLISQQTLDETIRKARELLDEVMAGKPRNKVANVTKLATTIGYLISRQTDVQKFLAEMEHHTQSSRQPISLSTVADAPMNKGFLPGADVQPGQTLVMREVSLRADHIPHHVINGKDGK